MSNQKNSMADELLKIGGSGAVSGGKGGGSAASAPSEAKDDLKSDAWASVLFCISEGQIEGFTDTPAQRIYLNDTAIQRQNGTNNFRQTGIHWRYGTPDQTVVPGMGKARQEYPVNVTVRKGEPATRTLIDPGASRVAVRIRIPSLLDATDKKGDIKATTLEGRIQISAGGGPFQTVKDFKFNNKTNNPYQQTYAFNLPSSTSNTWDIRVVRDTKDSDSVKLQNDLAWDAYTSIEDTVKNYPNTALLGLRLSSEQFSSVPEVSADLRGIRVLIPQNYDPYNRVYSGGFNGTLVPGWTSNPAWILYDLLTDDRYGLALPSNLLDVYSFYSAAIYNDGLVSTGVGNRTEPRYTCNCYIDSREDAYSLINRVASTFRANLYWSNGKIKLIQDAPRSAVRLYSQADAVVEVDDSGRESAPFEYACTDTTTRYTAAIVRYTNPQTWEVDDVYVEDAAAIARWGYKSQEIDAFACTSKSQARRIGKWALYTSLHQTDIVTFKVGSQGLLCEPGEVVKIADPSRAGKRLAGRIVSATANTVTLDAAVTLESGKSYKLSVLGFDGKQVEYQVVTGATTTQTLTISPAFAQVPVAQSLWMLSTATLEPQLFQVIRVTELEDNLYQIEAANYQPGKFDYVENGAALVDADVTDLPPIVAPASPLNLHVFEALYETTGSAGVRCKAQLFWGHANPERVKEYQIEFKPSSEGYWRIAGVSDGTSYEIYDIQPGIWDFRVKAESSLGLESEYTYLYNQQIYGLTLPPTDVTGLSLTPNSGTVATLSWDRSPDLDVRIGGYLEVKYSPKLDGIGVSDGVLLATFQGGATSGQVPLLKGSYITRWVDSSGNRSVNLTIVEADVSDALAVNVISELTQHPTFPGIGYKINKLPTNQITLAPQWLVDGWDKIDDVDDLAYWHLDMMAQGQLAIESYGEYYFDKIVDMGDCYTARIWAELEAEVFSDVYKIDQKVGNIDDWVRFDGGDQNNANARLQISISKDGVNWSNYQDFMAGEFYGRAFQFRVVLESYDQGYTNIRVSKLSATVDMPDRLDVSQVYTVAGGNTTVTFSDPFYEPPVVGVSFSTNNSGEYYTISNVTRTSFDVSVKSSAGANLARLVTYVAKGFGKSQLALSTSTSEQYWSSENSLHYFSSEDGYLIMF
ncbi:MAG TPA: phage tail protein [Trichocoleus sp.]|jgi:predicted phage tail protein